MPTEQLPNRLTGLHHITLTTGTAQGDVDFFVKLLGLRLVKRTLLYDGGEPIYHLYFGNYAGEPGTLTTTFPMRRLGRKGRVGAGQISAISYTAPKGSLDWWRDHLGKGGVEPRREERFGEHLLSFAHPDCGIGFEIIESTKPAFESYAGPYVPKAYALQGFHSWSGTVNEFEDMDDFLIHSWSMRPVGKDGAYTRYEMGAGGPSRIFDLRHKPDMRQGSWYYAEGIVHHAAFDIPDLDGQMALKFDIEGQGYTDISDRKHRGYFESVYTRTPGGMLFEAAKSIGMQADEKLDELGTHLMISPQFQDKVPELLARMNDPINL